MRGALAPLFIGGPLITESTVRQLIAERIEGTEYYILSVDIRPGNNIVVELENSGPVSITDCVAISRQIEHNLDREAEDFSLQVSSPGLDKPLRDYRQYIKNVGRTLKVMLADSVETEGELKAADESGITLLSVRKERVEGKKKKETITENLELKYPDIKQAKIKLNFK